MALAMLAQPVASCSKTVLTAPTIARRLFSTSRSVLDDPAPPRPKKGGLAEWVEQQRQRLPTVTMDNEVRTMRRRNQFSNGLRRAPFKVGAPLRPVDLKPANLINQFDRPRKRRAMTRLGPTRAETKLLDPFQRYGLNPLLEPHNIHLLTPYINTIGQIESRVMTGLCKKSQRRVAKAIRRARAMGLLPMWGATEGIASPVTSARKMGSVTSSWLR